MVKIQAPKRTERQEWMSWQLDRAVLMIVYVALGLTAFVVVVGGFVCLQDQEYSFQEYLQDLQQMSSWVLAAGIGLAAKLLVPFVHISRKSVEDES
jgi:hypothetical protein